VKVIAADTGLSEQEADARIEEIVAAAKKAREAVEEKARDAAEMARKSAILAAMMAAAVSLLGLVAAVWASTAAGHDRDHRRHLVIFGQPIW
jgi:type VI protein secretion system component VasF